MKYKTMSTKDYINLCIENHNNIIAENDRINNKNKEEEMNIQATNEGLVDLRATRDNNIAKYQKFTSDVKTMFLSECLYKVFNEALGVHRQDTYNTNIKRRIINNFLEETGVNECLRKFKTSSYILAEFARITEKYYNKVLESAACGQPETYTISPDVKDDFYDELNMQDIDDVVGSIRARVADAIEEFIQTNINNKVDIEDIIKSAQEKIDSAKNEEVRESYELIAKRKIGNISNKPRNVFFEMVSSTSKQILKNDSLKEEYMDNNKLNMDKIVEKCNILYTFLEMVNTMKIVNVDEAYIKNILENM